MSHNYYLIGAFETRNLADKAFSSLLKQGFDSEDISVIAKYMDKKIEPSADVTADNTAAAVTGGATLGGLAGVLASATAFPGLTDIIVSGNISTMIGMAGTAVSGAFSGTSIAAFLSIGLSESDAGELNTIVQNEGIVLVVSIDDERSANTVRKIYNDHAATMIATSNQDL